MWDWRPQVTLSCQPSKRYPYASSMRCVLTSALALLLLSSGFTPAFAQSGTSGTFNRDDGRGTDLGGVISNSLNLLVLEHGTRILFQEKTRRELSGPFWGDYRRSVRVPGQWGDTDAWSVNYIGHPIHGAAAGYIWLDHDPNAPSTPSMTKHYWASRGRATAWSAVYSLQFEVGPFSEASIGNVGMRPETTGWVDHVVTPLGALGFMVAEDALDQYVVKAIERHIGNSAARAALRVALNPGRALSNSTSGRMPWSRTDRQLGWR
jgi:hypothetical protein